MKQIRRLIPHGANVLVEPLNGETTAVRGILIPQKYQANQRDSIDCIIRELGTGLSKHFEPKIGDRVLVDRNQGQAIEMHPRHYRIVEERDILAIVEQ